MVCGCGIIRFEAGMEQFENEIPEGEPNYASPATILVLGILGVTSCTCFTGIPALVMGSRTLEAIENGQYPDKDKGLAEAGVLLGKVSLLLAAIGFVALAMSLSCGPTRG